MSPLINRINDQWLHPIVERISDRQRLLREKGTDFLTGLQERQEKLFDRGQRALNHFEETVLERVAEMLSWAYTRTGERSEAIKKSWDFVTERLDELHAEVEEGEEPLFEDEELEGIEVRERPVEVKPEPVAKAKPKAEIAPPFDNYDNLNVKKLAARFNDLNKEELRQARAYEAAHKNRKTVFEAIDRLMG